MSYEGSVGGLIAQLFTQTFIFPVGMHEHRSSEIKLNYVSRHRNPFCYTTSWESITSIDAFQKLNPGALREGCVGKMALLPM